MQGMLVAVAHSVGSLNSGLHKWGTGPRYRLIFQTALTNSTPVTKRLYTLGLNYMAHSLPPELPTTFDKTTNQINGLHATELQRLLENHNYRQLAHQFAENLRRSTTEDLQLSEIEKK